MPNIHIHLHKAKAKVTKDALKVGKKFGKKDRENKLLTKDCACQNKGKVSVRAAKDAEMSIRGLLEGTLSGSIMQKYIKWCKENRFNMDSQSIAERFIKAFSRP